MGKRWGLAVVSMLVAVSTTMAPGASAAVEVGDDCFGDQGGANYTLMQLSKGGGNPPGLVVPADGVATSWKVNSAGSFWTLPERLRVFRPGHNINEFRAIAESEIGTVEAGTNVFPTRIPVQAGDRFGVYATAGSGALHCSATGDEADVVGAYEGDVTVGTGQVFPEVKQLKVALIVTVEPDADRDGYGDETQDRCPQSAATQLSCPLVSTDVPLLTVYSFGLAKRNSALLLVSANSRSAIKVSGKVTLPKPGKGNGRARTIALNGGTQTLGTGQLGTFTLKFPAALKSALAALPRKQSLALTLSASTVDAAGRPSMTSQLLRLQGQAKPKTPDSAKR